MISIREHVLTLLPKGGTGAEIGVWNGDFSARILEVASPSKLHLIDPFKAQDKPEYAEAWYSVHSVADVDAIRSRVERRFSGELNSGRVHLHIARSQDVLPGFPEGSLDFIYIDGDHTYRAVKQDLLLGFQACRPGALICLDDYETGKWWQDGVVKASHEFLGEHAGACEIVLCHAGQLVIRKR